MLDETRIPDLKTLFAREPLIRFMNQLNTVSPIPISLMDNDGIIIYDNGSIGVDPADNVCRSPIKLKDIQIGTIIGHKSDDMQEGELTESLNYIGEMLTDRLAEELRTDDLASEIINSYQELNLLYELGESLSSVLDMESICKTVLEHAVKIVDPKMAFIMLIDPSGKQLVTTASSNNVEHPKGSKIEIEDSIYGSVIQDKTPLVIDDMEKYPHLKDKVSNADNPGVLFTTPLVCVPMIVNDKVSGIISMHGKLSGGLFTSEDTKLLYAIAAQAGMSLGNADLYGNLRELFLNTVESLAAAVEAKDPRTYGHCRRVAYYSMAIGEELGLTQKEIDDLRLAGILHDIGKIGIPEYTLRKPGNLSEEEMAEIRSHPVKGAEIIEHIGQMHEIAIWIEHHHERYDGAGYPDGLKCGEIPFHSRILAVADRYDEVISDGGQALSYPYDVALTELRIGSGSKFDPEIVDAFFNVAREIAYDEYLTRYKNCGDPSMPKLTRFLYYRLDNEITNVLAREALGDDLTESEREKLKESRALTLRR